jgi:hypothetical protein
LPWGWVEDGGLSLGADYGDAVEGCGEDATDPVGAGVDVVL